MQYQGIHLKRKNGETMLTKHKSVVADKGLGVRAQLMMAAIAACLPRPPFNIFLAIWPVFLQSPNEVYTFKRPSDLSEAKSGDGGAYSFLRGGPRFSIPKRHNCVALLSAGQVVRALPPNKVPLKEVYPKGQSSQRVQSSKKHMGLTFCSRVCFFSSAWILIYFVLLLSQMSHLHWQQPT